MQCIDLFTPLRYFTITFARRCMSSIHLEVVIDARVNTRAGTCALLGSVGPCIFVPGEQGLAFDACGVAFSSGTNGANVIGRPTKEDLPQRAGSVIRIGIVSHSHAYNTE